MLDLFAALYFGVKLMIVLVMVHWLIISTYTLLGLVGWIFYKPKSGRKATDMFEFVIVTKACDGVRDTLLECIRYHTTRYKNYQLHIVIDEHSDLTTEIKQLTNKINNLNLVIVPHSFKCRAVAKGRAIEYFIRTKVTDVLWYGFIDDDNRLLDDKFLYEVHHYNNKGYAASNPVLVARKGKSTFTYIADGLRYFDDKMLFRFGTGLCRRPIFGFHGELLIANGYWLKKIGFDRNTITEDFAFASELARHNLKVWQSATKVSVLSPHNITDFIRQRRRWYKGLLKDVARAPNDIRIFMGLRLVDWSFGICGSWLFFPLWFVMPLPLYLILYNLIGAVYHTTAYFRNIFTVGSKLKYIMFIPVYGIVEMLAPHYRKKATSHFEVIAK